MKGHVATLRVDLQADSLESRDSLLHQLVASINKQKPGLVGFGTGAAVVKRASVSRVRPAKR